ncbi:MAG: host attachment protein [Betaproteobacteria bacterium]|nr:host attachment protein [Betaproteobacteria bacterium]MCC6250589.1 host attachment protein [Rubrivivax sp.]MCL4695728.1 host attachment protein [Burkholderiaceae bacterium]
MSPQRITWAVVADEAIARLLERPEDDGELVAVEELTDPQAHTRESAMHHGPHGRRAGAGSRAGSQATVGAGDSERHRQAQVFAARIAKRLEEHHVAGRFAALHVIAAPRLLGYLRKALEPRLASVVVGTLDKDLVQESNAQLTQRLFAPAPGRG